MNTFPCPHCSYQIIDDGTLSGQVVACPQCHGAMLMPGESAPVVRSAPARTYRPRKGLWGRYMAWSGTRSLIFQAIFLGWTACMGLFALSVMVSAASDPDMRSDYEPHRRTAATAFLVSGICCPLSGYALVAIPLGIAAVATLEAGRQKN